MDTTTPWIRLDWLRFLYGMEITEGVQGHASAMFNWSPGDYTRYLVSVSPMVGDVARSLGCPGPYAWAVTRWIPSPEQSTMIPALGVGGEHIMSSMSGAGDYTAAVVAVIACAAIPSIPPRYAAEYLQALAVGYPDARGFRAPEPQVT